MSVSDREFVGSASFLAGVRGTGPASKGQSGSSNEGSGDESATPELVLQRIERMKQATVAQLAAQFGQPATMIQPNIDKLLSLELIQDATGKGAYSLSTLGQRARKFARMADPGA